MAFFQPFNFGYPFPQVTNPYTGKVSAFVMPPPSTSIPQGYSTVPANNKPLPPTVWGKNPPNAGLTVAGPVIPNNVGGTPDMSLLPKGWNSNWGASTLSWAAPPPPPPAPVMARLTAPAKAPAKAVAPMAKTAVTAPRAK